MLKKLYKYKNFALILQGNQRIYTFCAFVQLGVKTDICGFLCGSDLCSSVSLNAYEFYNFFVGDGAHDVPFSLSGMERWGVEGAAPYDGL